MRLWQTINSRRGSTMVVALMISMLLMVLVTATMALTLVDVQTTQDFARNSQTFQAADSGVVHANSTLVHALSGFNLPSSTSMTQVDAYAGDAEAGDRTGNEDISLLVDAGTNIEEVLPRQETSSNATLEYVSDGIRVGYDANVDITPTAVDHPEDGDASHRHVFHYDYEITSEGDADLHSQHNEATRRQTGSFDVEVMRPSFATYGYFTENSLNQFGQQLWFFDGEVYGGPTHVNSAPPSGQCAFWGQPTFNGPFTAVQETYEESLFGGGADPLFNDSATWGVDPITLPSNGWSQLRAAVGDLEHVDSTSPPTNSELRASLGLTAGTNPVDKGVYYSSNYNEGTSLLGGIFINGNASSISLDANGDNEVVTITMNNSDGGHFSGTHTWVFTENKAGGTTTVQLDGGTTQSFSGNLNGLIHAEGQINALRGDGGSGADIEASQAITVSATGNIYLADHMTYEENPVEYPDAPNILGIFSSGGNVYLDRDAPNNLHLDATVMATGTGHGIGAEGIVSGGHYDYYYPNKGQWFLTGGLIENTDQTTGVFYTNGKVTGYTWNFTYDQRFLEGVAPPYFPYVTKFVVTMLGMEPRSWGRKYY